MGVIGNVIGLVQAALAVGSVGNGIGGKVTKSVDVVCICEEFPAGLFLSNFVADWTTDLVAVGSS